MKLIMSTLSRDSAAEFPVDLKHILHIWKVLNGSRFSSATFGLRTLKGRRHAVALLVSRSFERVRTLTKNWTLEGPEDEPQLSVQLDGIADDDTMNPLVSSDMNVARKKSLITPEEFDEIRTVIHSMYKDRAHVTLKTLLGPVQEKLDRKIGKTTLYRVLRRMGFRYQ